MTHSRHPKPTPRSSPPKPKSSKRIERMAATAPRRSSLGYLLALLAVVASIAFLLRSIQFQSSTGEDLTEQAAMQAPNESLDSKSADALARLLQIPEAKPVSTATANEIETWTTILDQTLARMQRDYPNDAQVMHLHGLVQGRLKRTKLAEPSLRRCVALAPQDLQMRIDLADHLSQLGRDDEALSVLEEIDKGTALTSDYLNALGNCHTQLGQLEAAEKSYRLSLDNNSRQPDVWVRLGKVQLQLQKASASEQSARTAIESLPEDSEAWLLLGQALALLGRPEESRSSIEKSQEFSETRWRVAQRDLDGEHSTAMSKVLCSSFRSAAILYQSKGHAQRAQELYEQSHRVDANDSLTLINWSALLRRIGTLDRAIDIHRQLVKLQPHEPAHYQNLANIFMTLDRPIEAEAILRLCGLNQPENGNSQLLLARFLLLLNKPREAIGPARNAVAILDTPESRDVLSLAEKGLK